MQHYHLTNPDDPNPAPQCSPLFPRPASPPRRKPWMISDASLDSMELGIVHRGERWNASHFETRISHFETRKIEKNLVLRFLLTKPPEVHLGSTIRHVVSQRKMSKVPKRSNNIDRGKLEKKGSTVKGSASKKKPIDQSLSDSVFALSKNKEPPVPISTLPDNEKAWILGRSYDLGEEKRSVVGFERKIESWYLVCSTNLHHHSL